MDTAVPEAVKLTVYNAKGETVARLIDGKTFSGRNNITFNAAGLNSGVYYYTIETPTSGAVTKKMLLLK